MLKRLRVHSQSGATLIEVLVATLLLGIIVRTAIVQMESVNSVRASMERGQAIDVIEIATRPLLARDDVIKTSISKSAEAKLKSCLAGLGCTNGATYPIAMYLPRALQPFAGPSVGFDGSGTPCSMSIRANCKSKYKESTSVITRCSGTTTCLAPTGLSVKFAIVEIASGKVLRQDVVDRKIATTGLVNGLSLICPSGQILRGIGTRGEALCIKLSNLNYEDGGSGSMNIDVKPSDCRLRNNGANDQYFVKGYDNSGDLTCQAKEW